MKKKKLFLCSLVIMAVLAIAAAAVYLMIPRYYITQYADTTGLQAMFYTIESGRGHLIVIDGGNEGNADYVRQVIEEKGGHVDAWILTHPHPDHIGVFNVIWPEYMDKIDRIYAPDIDFTAYQNKAQEWDGFELYVNFLNYMSDCDKLTYLYEGDRFALNGLSFDVIYAYNAWVDQISKDIPNDGSLVFKVSAREESMLFCSDVGVTMSDTILMSHGEELKCDYIQMGHHGNGGLQENFYRATEAKGAFFDAPEWLMNPEEGKHYTTPVNRGIMESMGARIYYYNTAPNRIRIK